VTVQLLVAVASAISALLALRALSNFAHARRLRDEPADALDEWPSVSIVVPARDEATSIAAALASKLEQDYPHLQVVAVDDRSGDGTGDVMRYLAARDARLRVVPVDELPAGWLGKTHALAAGVEAADGEWLLLSDADVHLAPDCMRRAIGACRRGGFDFLAVVFQMERVSWIVEAGWSVFARLFGTAVDSRKVEDPDSRAAAGVGSFNLVRAAALERAGGFEPIRLDVTDDMALGMLLKRSGALCALMSGRDIVRVPAYRTVCGLLASMEKNGVTQGWWSLPAAVLGVVGFLLLDLSSLLAVAQGAATGTAWLLGLGAGCFATITAASVLLQRDMGVRRWPALFWPVGTVLLSLGVLRSYVLATARGGITWRGTFYPMEALRRDQTFKTV
jgi:hypothetical protein